MTSASLAVAVIGQALAQARGLVTKHAIKPNFRTVSGSIAQDARNSAGLQGG
jgi:hypothetical protein